MKSFHEIVETYKMNSDIALISDMVDAHVRAGPIERTPFLYGDQLFDKKQLRRMRFPPVSVDTHGSLRAGEMQLSLATLDHHGFPFTYRGDDIWGRGTFWAHEYRRKEFYPPTRVGNSKVPFARMVPNSYVYLTVDVPSAWVGPWQQTPRESIAAQQGVIFLVRPSDLVESAGLVSSSLPTGRSMKLEAPLYQYDHIRTGRDGETARFVLNSYQETWTDQDVQEMSKEFGLFLEAKNRVGDLAFVENDATHTDDGYLRQSWEVVVFRGMRYAAEVPKPEGHLFFSTHLVPAARFQFAIEEL